MLARLYRIRNKPDIPTASTQPRLSLLRSCAPHSDPISLFGAFVYVTNAILSLVLIGLLATPSNHALRLAMGDSTGLASVALFSVASFLAIPLAVAERRKTRGGNMLLPLWLLLNLFFNACRIRTFNAIPAIHHTAFFYVYIITFACQAMMLTVENAKGIHSTDVNSSHESRASFLSRLFFIWVFPMLWKGYRRPLELQDLDPLKPEYYGRYLAQSFIATWTGTPFQSQPQDSPAEQIDCASVHDLKTKNSRTSSEAYPLEKLASSRIESSDATYHTSASP